jgi:hypothetical protein
MPVAMSKQKTTRKTIWIEASFVEKLKSNGGGGVCHHMKNGEISVTVWSEDEEYKVSRKFYGRQAILLKCEEILNSQEKLLEYLRNTYTLAKLSHENCELVYVFGDKFAFREDGKLAPTIKI